MNRIPIREILIQSRGCELRSTESLYRAKVHGQYGAEISNVSNVQKSACDWIAAVRWYRVAYIL